MPGDYIPEAVEGYVANDVFSMNQVMEFWSSRNQFDQGHRRSNDEWLSKHVKTKASIPSAHCVQCIHACDLPHSYVVRNEKLRPDTGRQT